MRHIIIGTAGHVDHGKTSLVKAISGIDCDTHPEEKRRGITINNGYAYLKAKDDLYLAFIDVPGHQRFVNTMIAGVFGVDFVLLVVAADDGVMPQTKEHLQILSILGISRGAVVITKVDKVLPDYLLLCKEEVIELSKGTFLEGNPIFCVSTLSGQGLDELIDYLIGLPSIHKSTDTQELFRMCVDRVFTLKGFGTVLTGTVLGGVVRKNNWIYLSCDKNLHRIRQIHRHESEVDVVSKGERAALNIPDVGVKEICAGVLISDYPLPMSQLLDATLLWIHPDLALPLRINVIFLCGSFKTQGRVLLLGNNSPNDGSQKFIQIQLSSAGAFAKGDRYIIRDTSNKNTLGGGIILDPSPLVHRNLRPYLMEELSSITSTNPTAFITYKVVHSICPLMAEYFIPILQATTSRILEWARESTQITILEREKVIYFIDKNRKLTAEGKIQSALLKLYGINPLRANGFTIDEILQFMTKKSSWLTKFWVELTLEDSDQIVSDKNHYRLKGKQVMLSESDKLNIQFVKQIFHKDPNTIFLCQELVEELRQQNITEARLIQILRFLCFEGEIIYFKEFYLLASLVEDAKKKLLQFFWQTSSNGITVAQFRDILKSNRKTTILLFELFERQKLVERIGDLRLLTPKGLDLLSDHNNS